jgi:hypothetical protein
VAILLCVAWFMNQSAFAEDLRTVGVFIALCDNVHQGIVPVPKAVGDGEDPEHNLYWGCAEGFMGVFGKSPQWKKESSPEAPSANVLRTYAGRHVSGKMTLTAFAYQGSAIEECLKDFQAAVSRGKYDLVVYLGHNGLMDFYLDGLAPNPARKKKPECMVLCCMSQKYFSKHIACLEATPILLTTQFMYPGSFLLRDVLEEWVKGAGLKAYRTAAGNAYAANQKIPQKAALGVFADLEKAKTQDIPPDAVAGENEAAAMAPKITK